MAIAMLAVLSLPLLLRQGHRDPAPASGRRLVIVSPHVPQIREEFGRAFSDWHQRVYNEPAFVDWRVPGGTSEIIKQLVAQYNAALSSGAIKPDGSCPPGTMSVDLMLGGGSYDHGRLKRNRDVFVMVDDPDKPGEKKQQLVPLSVPAGFTKDQLDNWLGENRIGAERLYDPDQYWIGTALSSFGIVYNRDVLARLGLPDTSTFADLADPAYQNSVILADPRQSGSVTTAMDAILSNYGWDEGWHILRAMAANARYFTNSSTKPPIDVSQPGRSRRRTRHRFLRTWPSPGHPRAGPAREREPRRLYRPRRQDVDRRRPGKHPPRRARPRACQAVPRVRPHRRGPGPVAVPRDHHARRRVEPHRSR